MIKNITYTALREKVGTVQSIIYSPYPEQVDEHGLSLDVEIPNREDIPNMDAYLRINLETNQLYYDYIARETFETKLYTVTAENAELKQAIADLTMTMAAMMG
ncbi:hypothetical protein [Paenibacillus caui]|uniref:hypothetical protein n=1 Tax=Paenibacillus caui TaxID=2873927 RepID=UPI001CA929C3|nr:hypothetical protein [Paenibacillus caui]